MMDFQRSSECVLGVHRRQRGLAQRENTGNEWEIRGNVRGRTRAKGRETEKVNGKRREESDRH